MIRETFGGVLVNQIISKETAFKSERIEPFNMITLTVQGKSSLVESFETLIAGDLLTGDNKYQLPDGTKVSRMLWPHPPFPPPPRSMAIVRGTGVMLLQLLAVRVVGLTGSCGARWML